MAPMHIRHHTEEAESANSVRSAGYFRVTGTAPVTIGGARRTAVLADLIFTDPEAAHEVLTMRLPYRSVEIFDIEADPSIDSLALLDHEAPFLELPMLKVGEITEERTEEGVAGVTLGRGESTVDPRSVVAFSRRGNRVSLTFREEPDMAAPETTTTPPLIPVPKPANFTSDDDKDRENMASDEDDDKDRDMQGDTGLDVSAVVKAIESGDITVADMDMILAAIQSQGAAKDPVDEDELAPAPAPMESMRADRKRMSEFAALQGKVDALEANEVTRTKTTKRDTDVIEAMELLRGLPLGAELKANLFKFHKAHGGEAFGDYVQSLKKNTAIEPGDRTETAANFDALGGKLPDVAMKYQDQGTDAVQRAANFSRQYDDLMEVGSGMRTTREAYVAHNMARSA